MSHRLRRKPPGLVSIVARGPWSRFGTEERTGALFPATMLTGGEGKEGEKHEGDESNLWTCSVWVGMAGKGIPHGEQQAATTASRGGEVPVADSGRARAEEHRWGVRKLVAGSVWEEEGRRGRLHGELSIAGGGFAGKLSSRPRRPWRRWRRTRGRRKAACGGEGRPGLATVAAHARCAQHAQAASWRIWARLCSACLCVRGGFGRR